MADPRSAKPPAIKDVNLFARALTDLYGGAFEGLGREVTWSVFCKFFVRRALKHMESKFGGPIEGEEERAEALEHLEEELQGVLEEFSDTYFDSSEDGESIS